MKQLTHILVGIDFSECSANALKEASRMARWDGARLTALHILERDLHDEIRTHLRFEDIEILKLTEDRLRAFVNDTVGPTAGCGLRVELGHPLDRLLNASTGDNVDLLVLGTEGLTQDKRATGIIAAKCVRKVPLPVLLVREHQDRPFRKIAACVDFSETSRRALATAIHIAAQDGAALDLLNVVQPIADMIADMAAFSQVSSLPLPLVEGKDRIETARGDLEEFAAPLLEAETPRPPHTCHVVERLGISDAIIDFLRESGADLVVLGTRGRTGLRSLLLGTTAEKVLREVPCSALALKPSDFKSPV